jgi:His/Glu/Gln/Arg/opine family amino acid ABC transporter permease subunit
MTEFWMQWATSPWWKIISGLGVTLQYAALSVFFGFLWGTVLALFKVSRSSILIFAAKFYTSLFRGTPLLLQLVLVYYATPSLLNLKITIFQAGIVAFSLNSAAYVSETLKAGIRAIDRGQFEAAHALGLPYGLTMRDIILPQALKSMLPALVNEMINMIKESSLISIIGGADIMYRAQRVAAETYTYFEPLLIAGACYYTVIMGLTFLAHRLEKRFTLSV